jgi:hypothetical protein
MDVGAVGFEILVDNSTVADFDADDSARPSSTSAIVRLIWLGVITTVARRIRSFSAGDCCSPGFSKVSDLLRLSVLQECEIVKAEVRDMQALRIGHGCVHLHQRDRDAQRGRWLLAVQYSNDSQHGL